MDVPLPLDFSGRVAGYRVVEIRSQVNGLMLKREYQEGSVVEVGQVLFRIDPRTYEAALARANAQAEVSAALSEIASRPKASGRPMLATLAMTWSGTKGFQRVRQLSG